MTDTVVEGISDDESSLDSRQDPLVHDAERSAAREAASVYAHFEGMDGPANARDEMQANVAAANAMRYAQVFLGQTKAAPRHHQDGRAASGSPGRRGHVAGAADGNHQRNACAPERGQRGDGSNVKLTERRTRRPRLSPSRRRARMRACCSSTAFGRSSTTCTAHAS